MISAIFLVVVLLNVESLAALIASPLLVNLTDYFGILITTKQQIPIHAEQYNGKAASQPLALIIQIAEFILS